MSLLYRNTTNERIYSSITLQPVFSFPLPSGVMLNNGTVRVSCIVTSDNATVSDLTLQYKLKVGGQDLGNYLELASPATFVEQHRIELFLCASGTDKLQYNSFALSSDNGSSPNVVRTAQANTGPNLPTISWAQDQLVEVGCVYSAADSNASIIRHFVVAEVL